MLRFLLAVVLSATLQFAWGFAFWSGSPMSKQMIQGAPEEEKIAEVLRTTLPDSGVYFLPYPVCMDGECDESTQEQFLHKHQAGPLVQIVYRREGLDAMSPVVLGLGFAHFLASSLLAGFLLFLAGPGLPHFFSRVLFVCLLGVFATLTIQFANPIWFHHPWKFTLLHSVYDVGCWIVSAFALAGLIRRAA